jgi:GNAT superfamily N-acetyltransferase
MVARKYAVDKVLRDGGFVHIRAIRPDDKQRLLDAFHRLSGRSVYLRFFGSKQDLSQKELTELTEIDFVRHVALVVTLWENGEERIIGVGRYIVMERPWPTRHAEIALAVADEHQGRGIGTILLEDLVSIARAGGISGFEADVLAENRKMLDIFSHSGFHLYRSIKSRVVHVSFSIVDT